MAAGAGGRSAAARAGGGEATRGEAGAAVRRLVNPPDDASASSSDEHTCTAAELIDAFENLAELWSGGGRSASASSCRRGTASAATPSRRRISGWRRGCPAVLSTLESNRDVADFEVFGVSAQGGALEARDELLAKGEVCDRVFAEDRGGRRISLVEPVRWAIWGS